MEPNIEAGKKLDTVFDAACKSRTEDFFERLSKNPEEELKKVQLTVDEMHSHLHLLKSGETSGLQILRFLNAELMKVAAAIKVDPFGGASDRIVAPTPGPPPPVYDVWPSPEALGAQLTVVIRLIQKDLKSKFGGKTKPPSKKAAKLRTTRKRARR